MSTTTPDTVAMLRALLKDWGYKTQETDDGQGAVDAVHTQPFDLILMDVRMSAMSGIEALKAIKTYNPAIPILIMTAYSSVSTAVDALKSGAYDYLTKPLDAEELRLTLERALDHTRLQNEVSRLRSQLPRTQALDKLLGSSPAMRHLKDMISTVAPSDATVLITGESGTGKELIARAIHELSSRADGPLVTVNCAALSETLLESELFGHEKGAFTGADKMREGRFKAADNGSIFLDEIGEISASVQAKLLRVLQEREIQRVGGEYPIKVDVRILAATNKDLREEVAAGNFREDLYYRLNVVLLESPPLRQRTDDIPLLAQEFLSRFTEKNNKSLKGFTPQAMDILLKAPWPGNVRELENAVERAVIMAPGEYVSDRELPLHLQNHDGGSVTVEPTQEFFEGGSLEELERKAILNTLDQVNGNKSEASRRLGITRATLHKKLKKFGMD